MSIPGGGTPDIESAGFVCFNRQMNATPKPANSAYSRAAHIMAKPIGPRCNQRCKYCFYLEKHALFADDEDYRMSDEVLERFVREYIAWQNTPQVEFAWQGGEPTLLGVDFFRKAVEYQRKYGQGRTITNAFQTNGTLLDDEWCEFLAKEKFLVGLSLDGPAETHNRYRMDANGKGSFDNVYRGLQRLRKHGVEFNALTCITRESAYEGRKIYRFLRDQGIHFMQFIPIIERRPEAASNHAGLELAGPPDLDRTDNPSEVMPFTVEPAQYGQFLIDIFNEWIKRDVGRYFVNHFDIALAAWMGMNPPLCFNSKICGSALALEHDGSIYACDHYVYPEYRRGNIMDADLQNILLNMDQQNFGISKWTKLPPICRECPVLFACHGGCPKHRFCNSPAGDPGLNYLCPGFKKFFLYVKPYMERMAALLKQQRSPAEIMHEQKPKRRGTKSTSSHNRKKKKKGKKKSKR